MLAILGTSLFIEFQISQANKADLTLRPLYAFLRKREDTQKNQKSQQSNKTMQHENPDRCLVVSVEIYQMTKNVYAVGTQMRLSFHTFLFPDICNVFRYVEFGNGPKI